ncbi:uncharacterized protein LOC144134918 [Amblyomma americanum]
MGGNVPTQELEQHEANDTSIKRRLIVGAICVIFIAGIFSYLIIDSLAGVSHPGPRPDDHDYEWPPPSNDRYHEPRNRRTTPNPPTDELDTTSNNDTVPSTAMN